MNSFREINVKIAATMVAFASLFFVGHVKNTVKAVDQVDVNAVTSTVRTNMLDVNTAVVTKAKMTNLIGKNQQITATFGDLKRDPNRKIFAVLNDVVEREVKNAQLGVNDHNGVIDAKYLDDNNMVTFSDIPEYIKIPGIHLYYQDPSQPPFTLDRNNFIASTSYLMPYGKKLENNGGLEKTAVQAYKGDGSVYTGVPSATLYRTTVPDVYSFALPSNTLPFIEGTDGVAAQNLLAVVIPYDENDNLVDEHRQWVAADYNEMYNNPGYLCRFEFLVPKNTKKFQVHIYKNGLYSNTFLCKYLINLDKQDATDYSTL